MRSKIEIETLKERFNALDSEEIEIALQTFPYQFLTAEINRRFYINEKKEQLRKELESIED